MRITRIVSAQAFLGVLTTVACSPVAPINTLTLVNQASDFPGCIDEDTEHVNSTQRIQLHSGDDLFEIFVPVSEQTYNIGEPSPVLFCVQSAKDGPCVHCHLKMDHVQLTRPGICSFLFTDENRGFHDYNISDKDGLVFFDTPGYPALVSCHQPESITHVTRDQKFSVSGCIGGVSDELIQFHSGTDLYQMFVPKDGNSYNIGEPSPSLLCISGAQDGPCGHCHFKMDNLRLFEPGFCSFLFVDDSGTFTNYDISDTAGIVSIGTPGFPSLVTCQEPNRGISDTQTMVIRQHLPSPTRPLVQNTNIPVPRICPQTYGSNLTLWNGLAEYILSVPANQKRFPVYGDDTTLGCVGPVGDVHALCLGCTFKADSLQISREAKLCAIEFDEYQAPLYLNNTVDVLILPVPANITAVTCGLDTVSPPNTNSSLSRRQAPASACPTFADTVVLYLNDMDWLKWNLFVSTDGKTLQLDHPGSTTGCIRAIDNQCFYCDFGVQEVVVPADVTCKITISSNGSPPTTIDFGPGISRSTNEMQLHDIACQKVNTATPLSVVARSLETATVLRQTANTECPSFDIPATIRLLDYNLFSYDLELRPDATTFNFNSQLLGQHAGCRRRSDTQCFSCDSFLTISMLMPLNAGCEYWYSLNGSSLVESFSSGPGVVASGVPILLHNITCQYTDTTSTTPTGARETASWNAKRVVSQSQSAPKTTPPSNQCGIFQDQTEILFKDLSWMEYKLTVRTDGSVFKLDNSESSVGCVEQGSSRSDECILCNFEVAQVVVKDDVFCVFGATKNNKTAFSFNTTAVSAFNLSEFTWDPPIHVHSVKCQKTTTMRLAGSQTTRPKARSDNCPLAEGKISLQSASGTTTLHVPADGEAYWLQDWISSQPHLGCLNANNKQDCSSCDEEYTILDYEPDLGLCRFDTTDSRIYYFGSGILPSSNEPPFTPSRVICGIKPDRFKARTIEPAGHCNMTNAPITLTTDIGQFTIYPPADQKPYPVDSEIADSMFPIWSNRSLIGCHAVQMPYHYCGTCDSFLKSAQIDPKLGMCQFSLINKSNPSNITAEWINATSKSGEFSFGPQRYLVDIQCGLSKRLVPATPTHPVDSLKISTPYSGAHLTALTRRVAKAQHDTEYVSGKNRFHSLAFPVEVTDTSNTTNLSNMTHTADCPASAVWRTAIIGSDGNMYFAPIPLDMEFHPLADMSCLRMVDSACIPCAQIPSVTGVSIHTEGGPCIFFTEDHRQFAVPWTPASSPGVTATDITWVQPAAVLSGIECGTGV
ncbi:hypothetical protein H2198_009570 [Neophaeococcomyces mojaviensis]|uniref:Uncharacterized protein n=1 Tax=Neophaeococcomyces mojaviensis TaxID=3383035 RepID=A0ACC2ZUM4_9EURO|nr:hypothetical protein H2198_009570 [Knufia sp. JES_112]